ncbi:hypothetical protein [Levilactobacillus zymae]|uniref:hypothetical protein n=1 Tax=Levilactobacillus zymae TaxID=267363 RepID=UPI0028BA551A|nr:hypothetical protein [Levilactobacillus zymae]MDT6979427.1 hypothetical protein [Levilactobacillus zymae]
MLAEISLKISLFWPDGVVAVSEQIYPLFGKNIKNANNGLKTPKSGGEPVLFAQKRYNISKENEGVKL